MQEDYFELFGLPRSYQLDQQQLATRFRELQQVVHPDRHAAANERDQRLSVQYAAHVNDAYQTLKAPVPRAIYLLRCRGIEPRLENNTVMDAAFLMQQMEWREALDELRSSRSEADLEALRSEADSQMGRFQAQFSELWQGEAKALEQAESLVMKMQFVDKLQEQLDQLEDELLDDY
ncbi:Fe-S protein assembly co-chaperone HscB [Aestuariirhabdus litorea]|uniref:Co-chaperone protein HscB homolog n=1 Tax=Aestuariirhabdus litorea TaxID=2528527 RepID=A0A3P3VP37_9GAMM|nr:Fe-S protein assembly co-chaperone HscB [Aestuariirhabdus litorea]RRJ83416.1 Fe-S protein assembly co-chaperone HscB [Aestuariirhabdus litorea]RWW93577.1 Fe-S protein assembly co-chaperone HscB [Endozoicomonadaceae bacterium GTF-13]